MSLAARRQPLRDGTVRRPTEIHPALAKLGRGTPSLGWATRQRSSLVWTKVIDGRRENGIPDLVWNFDVISTPEKSRVIVPATLLVVNPSMQQRETVSVSAFEVH